MKPHTLDEHVGRACATAGHALPQPPQLFGLVVVSTQTPLQLTVAPVQPLTQANPPPLFGAQRGVPPEQTLPQAPQLAFSERSTSQPSLAVLLQSSKPG